MHEGTFAFVTHSVMGVEDSGATVVALRSLHGVRARERPFKSLAFERSCEYEYARSGSVWVFATRSENRWIEWKKSWIVRKYFFRYLGCPFFGK